MQFRRADAAAQGAIGRRAAGREPASAILRHRCGAAGAGPRRDAPPAHPLRPPARGRQRRRYHPVPDAGPSRPPSASAAAPGCCREPDRTGGLRQSPAPGSPPQRRCGQGGRRHSAEHWRQRQRRRPGRRRRPAPAPAKASPRRWRECRSRSRRRARGEDGEGPTGRAPAGSLQWSRAGRSRRRSPLRRAARSAQAGRGMGHPARGCGSGRCGTPRTVPGFPPASPAPAAARSPRWAERRRRPRWRAPASGRGGDDRAWRC